MAVPALLPALALIAGISSGVFAGISLAGLVAALPLLCSAAAAGWRCERPRTVLALLGAGCWAAGAALGAHARAEALAPALRTVLEQRIGGFAIDTPGPEHDHDPIVVLVRLTEDASPNAGVVSLRGRVVAIETQDGVIPVDGTVLFSVGGIAAAHAFPEWTAGRTLRMPATFRRPARYLNEGVPDFERTLALDGTTLFGSVKSGLTIEVASRGSRLAEAGAAVRAHVRAAAARHVGPHSQLSAGIVSAVLIGDRSGLPVAIRDRLQRAGTYHVIAISGGNIAILAAAAAFAFALAGIRGRAAAALTMTVLLGYAAIATAGPSVLRATLMAVFYLAARAIDHRTPPWQTTLLAAAVMAALHPLDVRDPGFILTFGATVALLEGARRGRTLGRAHPPFSWLAASLIASASAEIVLLPVAAQVFSRITVAGLLLNVIAVPLMAVVQLAGLFVAVLDRFESPARVTALVAHEAAAGLVESARLIEIAPWLTTRVPPPGATVLLLYYAALGALLAARSRRLRHTAATTLAAAALMIVTGTAPYVPVRSFESDRALTVTMFDVGQGEAILVRTPDGRRLLVDAGGAPFGGGSFDIGARVLAPALWARQIRSLDVLVLTHGDPDHTGGAAAILEDFTPRAFWEGIAVPAHEPSRALRDRAVARRIPIHVARSGESFPAGAAAIRVLHPPEPDWERQRIRNDDSIVLEIVHGDVAVLLTGDISAGIERAIVPRLTQAPVRVLKVAHHGSRSSTSAALLDAWQPQIAIVSAGRGNTFGHPAAEVLTRLEAIGATVLRTDRHGEITIVSDGRQVRWRTHVPDGQ
jgi:competence protein ComEC